MSFEPDYRDLLRNQPLAVGEFEKATARADGGVAPCSESLTRLNVRCGSCARCALPSARSLWFFNPPCGALSQCR